MDHIVHDVALCLRLLSIVPGMWKVDIDAAFRRVPLKDTQRWAGAIAFKVGDKVGVCVVRIMGATVSHVSLVQIWISFHFACPFGAIGSVHAWERG
jgi:hypothetical protein